MSARAAVGTFSVLSLLAAATARTEAPPPSRTMKLFLLIGQSNMAGRGKPESQDKVPHPRVFAFSKELAWTPAVDPLHWDKPERIGVGLGLTFGRTVADADPAAVVGLIPAAFGGSALDEWAPGTPHYTNAVARAREAAKNGKLAGILWHQGEADAAPEKVATYVDRFTRTIAQLRADLGAETVPLIVGEPGRFRPANAAVNAVLATLPSKVPRSAFVSSEGLVPNDDLDDQGQRVHFDTPSFRELGRRYAKAWLELAAR
jgi:hypothetical protein